MITTPTIMIGRRGAPKMLLPTPQSKQFVQTSSAKWLVMLLVPLLLPNGCATQTVPSLIRGHMRDSLQQAIPRRHYRWRAKVVEYGLNRCVVLHAREEA